LIACFDQAHQRRHSNNLNPREGIKTAANRRNLGAEIIIPIT